MDRLGRTGRWLAVVTAAAALLLPVASAQDGDDSPRAWLGVTLGNVEAPERGEDLSLVTPLEQAPRGVRITGVVKDSPAARSGLRAGDIVLTVDGMPVDATDQLVRKVASFEPGRWVELAIRRRGDERSLSVRLGERPEVRRQLDVRRAWAGLTLIDVPRQLQESWGGEDGTGVLVGAVEPGSPADVAGVLPGDLVIKVDGEPVHGAYELLPLLRSGGVGNSLALEISRQGTLLDVDVELIEEPPREEREPQKRSSWREWRSDGSGSAEDFFAGLAKVNDALAPVGDPSGDAGDDRPTDSGVGPTEASGGAGGD